MIYIKRFVQIVGYLLGLYLLSIGAYALSGVLVPQSMDPSGVIRTGPSCIILAAGVIVGLSWVVNEIMSKGGID